MRNGRIPKTQLTPIGSGCTLIIWAAAVWEQMVADALKDGVHLAAYPTPDYPGLAAYRDVKAQKFLYNKKPHNPALAKPGTYSPHGFGTAIDVGSGLEWMLTHATHYGVIHPLGDRDKNHFVFTKALPVQEPLLPEATMNQIPFISTGGAWHWYVFGAGWQTTTDIAFAKKVKASIGIKKSTPVSAAEWADWQVILPNPKA
jgi:D-alanyl-D-alanine carboxypeptidase